MRLLVDTNIFLEILLEQSRAEEAKHLLRKVDQHDFFISDFALHSVGPPITSTQTGSISQFSLRVYSSESVIA